jgi:hypothetical protein
MDFKNNFNNSNKRAVVQHSGWLLKRGEGYDDDAMPGNNTEKDESPEKKVVNKLERLLAGKSEKKRFFKLVRIEEKGPGNSLLPPSAMKLLDTHRDKSSGGGGGGGPNKTVELRYYAKADAPDESIKGFIPLTAECELKTTVGETTLKLVTPGRSYYLRPEGDSDSAQAQTTALQWADAIRRELRLLWAADHAFKSNARGLSSPGIMSTRLTRGESVNIADFNADAPDLPTSLDEVLNNTQNLAEFKQFLETALASENIEFYEAIEALSKKQPGSEDFRIACEGILKEFVSSNSSREVNLSSGQRARLLEMGKNPGKMKWQDFIEAKTEIVKLMDENFFKRFLRDATDRTGAFSALYATLGWDGFVAVLNHFGPVKTDLDRTIIALKSTVSRVQAQIDVLQASLARQSRDVAVISETGLSQAIISSYALQTARLEALLTYCDELRTEVVKKLEDFKKKLETDLDLILKRIAEPRGVIQSARKLLDEAKVDFEKVRNNTSSTPTQLDQARQLVLDCEHAFEHAENVNSKAMELALSFLESLELLRLETQSQLVRHALKAESNMNEELKQKAQELLDAISDVDIEKEIRAQVMSLNSDLGPIAGF